MKRGDKIYLDRIEEKESYVNHYLTCRDGIVERVEYRDCSGYGSKVRLYYCENTKHESISIVRQTYTESDDSWFEEEMTFDSDSFKFLEALLVCGKSAAGGEFKTLRNYNNEQDN